MKKLLVIILALSLLMGVMPALADGVSEVMQVVNCSEYVSLRETPDTSAKRLEKVHLGELVYNCEEAANGFVKCAWEGKTGYILAKYLKTTSYKVSDGILPNQMVYNCSEYVSLRKAPDTSSERLVKVPLGAVVTGCVSYNDQFILCQYKGKTGYVLKKYLKKADYTKLTPTPTPTPKTYAALPYYMQVVNCEAFVNLRATASTSAAVVKQVPLGAVVENCVQVSDTFVNCVYDGSYGYININYLKAYEPPADSAFDDLDFPSYELFKTRGEAVLEQVYNGCTVVVRRAFGEKGEEIMAVCYDASMHAVWTVGDKVAEPTELTLTDALVSNGNLVMYVNGKGLTAYGIGAWTDVKWHIDYADVSSLGGGLQKAVAADGTMYLMGYYSTMLYCVSPDGEILWSATHENDDVYWPYYIALESDGVRVYFDSGDQAGMSYTYLFSYAGEFISSELKSEIDISASEQEAVG